MSKNYQNLLGKGAPFVVCYAVNREKGPQPWPGLFPLAEMR
jgi:hypothetical protein